MGYDHHTLVENLKAMDDVRAEYNGSAESWSIKVTFVDPEKESNVLAAVSQTDDIQYETDVPSKPYDWLIKPDGFR